MVMHWSATTTKWYEVVEPVAQIMVPLVISTVPECPTQRRIRLVSRPAGFEEDALLLRYPDQS